MTLVRNHAPAFNGPGPETASAGQPDAGRQDSPQTMWRFSRAQHETCAQSSGQLAPSPAGFGFKLRPSPQNPLGNSNLRNPILASFVAKGVLPYRGLGSGVPRALEAWPDIDFRDDRGGGLFVATVRRNAAPADLRGIPTAQVTAQVTAHVLALLEQLEGELTRSQLQAAVGLTHREHFRKAYLLAALEAGLIEMTQPDKPNSRSQRYRLTPAGEELRRQRGTTTQGPKPTTKD
jgi:hypothetical protein